MWIHINFWFDRLNKSHRTKYYLSPIQQKKFHKLIKKIINNPFIKRKFFLYEPSPHCFLALEISDYLAQLCAYWIIKICETERLKFIKKVTYTLNCADENNGNYFLNCLNAFREVTLSKKQEFPYWLKKFPLKNLRMTAHIIHCCLNQITNSRPLERRFYKTMYRTYKCK